MNLEARSSASTLVSLIESRMPEEETDRQIHYLVNALGGIHYLLQDMTPQGRLLYILALHLRQHG